MTEKCFQLITSVKALDCVVYYIIIQCGIDSSHIKFSLSDLYRIFCSASVSTEKKNQPLLCIHMFMKCKILVTPVTVP